MRVIVDWDRCDSNALGTAAVPEVFRVDEDDVLRVLDETRGDEVRSQVKSAFRACPMTALVLVE